MKSDTKVILLNILFVYINIYNQNIDRLVNKNKDDNDDDVMFLSDNFVIFMNL